VYALPTLPQHLALSTAQQLFSQFSLPFLPLFLSQLLSAMSPLQCQICYQQVRHAPTEQFARTD